ncbi:HAD family hydrolase [Streptomyces sp. NPDC057620]|uniref:HAD family hydrolase n=1 Tax=Streptomyces sp. NPDC057620 TaxID=3346185 RepID=UPI0036A8753B
MSQPRRATPPTPRTDRIRGVVFDLDGTLIDSWTLHQRCLRYAATATVGAEPSAARLALAQRPTDTGTLRALVGDAALADATRAYRHALRNDLRVPATARGLAVAYAHEILALLRERGLATGVCTGRSRQDAQTLLDASGLGVDLSIAREDTPRPKPAPDGLLRALQLLRLRPEEALYVGDTQADACQGESAGVRTLLLQGPGSMPGTRAAPLLASLRDLSAYLRKADT